ncbi:hypothetical protein LPN04_18375 [Rugamonas sp. A1-17]|nr:hypothetical protein [Rugamonas sp. A1-17]
MELEFPKRRDYRLYVDGYRIPTRKVYTEEATAALQTFKVGMMFSVVYETEVRPAGGLLAGVYFPQLLYLSHFPETAAQNRSPNLDFNIVSCVAEQNCKFLAVRGARNHDKIP